MVAGEQYATRGIRVDEVPAGVAGGVDRLEFPAGQGADSLGLTGTEVFDISGVTALNDGVTPHTVSVRALRADGSDVSFDAVLRIDTPGEADYYRNGGILQYVLRSLM